MVADVIDGDDVGVVAEPAHGAGFPCDAHTGGFVYLFRLYQGEGDVPVQCGVVGEVDPLLAALAEEPLDMVSAVGEGRWLGGRRRCWRRSLRPRAVKGFTALDAELAVRCVLMLTMLAGYFCPQRLTAFFTELGIL
jgi:hypothetical protein